MNKSFKQRWENFREDYEWMYKDAITALILIGVMLGFAVGIIEIYHKIDEWTTKERNRVIASMDERCELLCKQDEGMHSWTRIHGNVFKHGQLTCYCKNGATWSVIK